MTVTLSVVIPTRNRMNILENTLILLESQTLDRSLFEVIVVDDGSEDGTYEYMQGFTTPLSLKYIRQDFRGASCARNVGVKNAAGEYVVFLGDDVHPSENLLEIYYEKFQQNEGRVFFVGRTIWAKHLLKSSFIRYLEDHSHAQFMFNHIKDRDMVPPQYFNTANSAIPVRYLISCGLFDESLTLYEDTELGMRLARLGLRLCYSEEAVAYHNHRVSLSSYIRRQIIAGENACLCALKDPPNERIYSFSEAFFLKGNPLLLPKKIIKKLLFNEVTIPCYLRYLKDERKQFLQPFLYNGILSYYHRVGVRKRFKSVKSRR